MPSDVTFVNVRKSFQALAGLESMTEMDNFFFEQSLNRAVQRAYDSSESWARYLVTGEERNVTAFKVSGYAEDSGYNGLFYKIGELADGSPVYGQVGKTSGGQRADSQIYQYNSSTKDWTFAGVSWTKNLETGIITIVSGTGINTQRDTSIEYDHPWEVVWSTLSGKTPQLEQVQIIPYSELVEAYASSDPAQEKTTITEFIRIHRKKAFLNESSIEYDFFVDNNGANILNAVNDQDGVAYVTYKKPVSTYSETSTDVPAEFFDYIIYSVLSDFYTGDGQTEKALIAEQTAEKMLEKELFKIDVKSNNNSTSRKFSTYVNRQSR